MSLPKTLLPLGMFEGIELGGRQRLPQNAWLSPSGLSQVPQQQMKHRANSRVAANPCVERPPSATGMFAYTSPPAEGGLHPR
jgi:hypothetical protein